MTETYEGKARDTDPQTSKDAAAEANAREQRQVYRALLLALHSSHPYGLTDHQAAQQAIEYYGATGDHEGVRRRMGDLRDKLGWAQWMRRRPRGDVVRDGRRGMSELTNKGLVEAGRLMEEAAERAQPGRLV